VPGARGIDVARILHQLAFRTSTLPREAVITRRWTARRLLAITGDVNQALIS